jgi:hypothetical protein
MARLDIREISEANNDWDELVEKSPQGTFFHSSDWLKIMQKYYHYKIHILECYDQASDPKKIIGGCVFFTYNRIILKIAIDEMIFTPFGGVILASQSNKNQRKIESYQSEIIDAIIGLLKEKKYDRVSLTHSPALIDVRPFSADNWKCEVRYTYILELENELEKNFTKEAKWSINKAIKNKISIRKVESPSLNDLNNFLHIHKMTLKRHEFGNIYLFTEKYLADIIDLIYKKDKGSLWFAETSTGEVIAAEIVLYDHNIAHRWSAASHNEFQNTGATTYLLSEISKYLRDIKKYYKFNMMAANKPEIASFISQFNPQLIPYYTTSKRSWLYNILFAAIREK